MKCKHCGRPLDPSKPACGYCGAKNPAAVSRSAPRGKTAAHGGAAAQQLPKWLVPAACGAALLLIVTGVLVMMLGGNDAPSEAPEDKTAEVAVIVTDAPTETTEAVTETETVTETVPAEFTSDTEWANAYYETMRGFEEEHKEVNAERGIKYRLLYIDDDEVPELYMQAGDASALYTYAEDEVKRIYKAESSADEKLIGVRTRCGTYLSSRVNAEGERYAVNELRSGVVSETESYHTDGDECIINGASVDLVSFTEFVRAKQAAYQLTDIPVYYKTEMLTALDRAANGEDIPEMASEEETVEITETTEEASEAAESGDKRFAVYAGAYTWSQAQAQCEAKGGHLAYIKSAEDYASVMEAVNAAGGDLSYLWVGGKTTITDSGVTAKWNDGSATSYLDSAGLWFGSEPSGKDGDVLEPYMMLWNPGGGWSFNDNSDSCVDIYASGTMGYICEFDE